MSSRRTGAPVRQGAGLLVTAITAAAVLAGCGSAPATTADGRWSLCAKVPTPTAVDVRRTVGLPQSQQMAGPATVHREGAVAHRLFSDFCRTVAKHVHVSGATNCPDDFGLVYTGSFHADDQAVGTFRWHASGCQTLDLDVGGHHLATAVVGAAATASPSMDKDFQQALGVRTVGEVFAPRG